MCHVFEDHSAAIPASHPIAPRISAKGPRPAPPIRSPTIPPKSSSQGTQASSRRIGLSGTSNPASAAIASGSPTRSSNERRPATSRGSRPGPTLSDVASDILDHLLAYVGRKTSQCHIQILEELVDYVVGPVLDGHAALPSFRMWSTVSRKTFQWSVKVANDRSPASVMR